MPKFILIFSGELLHILLVVARPDVPLLAEPLEELPDIQASDRPQKPCATRRPAVVGVVAVAYLRME